jgi:hypothetical protein
MLVARTAPGVSRRRRALFICLFLGFLASLALGVWLCQR